MLKNYKLLLMVVSFLISTKAVNAQCTFTTVAPYFESFNNVTTTNQMPNCSWWATGSWFTSAVPGNKHAGFNNVPAGTSYFYSNGILLNAGVTYSASVWYSTASTTFTNWSNFTMWLATSQTTNGLQGLASTIGPAISLIYTALSNTFMVQSTGIYYLAISATGSGAAGSNTLRWDDLTVSIPCSLNPTSINAIANTSTICIGQSATITATGANTYTWNTGSQSQSISVSPVSNTFYQVNGTNTLTGCSAQALISLAVSPAPVLNILANGYKVCKGSSITINANNSSYSYTWSNGSNMGSITVSPSVTTSYSVLVKNVFGCTTQASMVVVVDPVPTLSVVPMATFVCSGDVMELKAFGALSYTWSSVFAALTGSNIQSTATTDVTYTLSGIDANSCTGTLIYPVKVNTCAGIENYQVNSPILYPNPTNNQVTLEFNGEKPDLILLNDMKGNLLVPDFVFENGKCEINLRTTNSGVYLLTVKTGIQLFRLKLVKN